jgi:hypothetical protein
MVFRIGFILSLTLSLSLPTFSQDSNDIVIKKDLGSLGVSDSFDDLPYQFFVRGETALKLLELKTKRKKRMLFLRKPSIPGIQQEFSIRLTQAYRAPYGGAYSLAGHYLDPNRSDHLNPDWEWGIMIEVLSQHDYNNQIIKTEEEVELIKDFLLSL